MGIDIAETDDSQSAGLLVGVNQEDFRSTQQILAHQCSQQLYSHWVRGRSHAGVCQQRKAAWVLFLLLGEDSRTKRNLEMKGLFQFHITAHHQRKSEQKLKTGVWSQEVGAAEEAGLLLIACLIPLPDTLQTTCPGVATPTVCWPGLPIATINQDTPQRLTHRPVLWRDFLNRGNSSSQMTQAWAKLTTSKTTTTIKN